ncbi:hypothetical protein M409DRAFT_17690 [Zasmidium cellare ATCC 36951]|uniref:F-box domain-containing protein n=1 Tax=Zasmidium cellare ATCC 36951 TaxID=1080233 RepID=A0A6A6D1Z2_ZASCE|nr:uncharacterized protein M409DRAFT_17690 [Zasmidium cellare ATCC 36951]KAF2172458.1 hypothetical protein M409DRAFT_17690 [Zasmidium cellare ATCC 36951]
MAPTPMLTSCEMDETQLPLTAASKAFATTELLEDILLYLPNKTLSKLKQVSRHWKATIEGSQAIRKQLFLKSGDFDTFRLGGVFHPSLLVPGGTVALLNPMLEPYSDELERLPRAKRGAWQRTLATQPATTELKVTIFMDPRSMSSTSLVRAVKNDRGVTIKDVADWVRTFCEHMSRHRMDIHMYLSDRAGLMG